MPSIASSRDPVKCGMVPLLGTPNDDLAGLALSQVTSAEKSFAPVAGPATTANSKRASSETGTKSLAWSKLGFASTIGNRYMVGPVVIRIVVPSGAAFITDLIPIRPSAPVRFSTMMVRSSARRRCSAMRRHSMSPLPPAANGKISLVSGPDWASALPGLARASAPAHPAMNSRRSIAIP